LNTANNERSDNNPAFLSKRIHRSAVNAVARRWHCQSAIFVSSVTQRTGNVLTSLLHEASPVRTAVNNTDSNDPRGSSPLTFEVKSPLPHYTYKCAIRQYSASKLEYTVLRWIKIWGLPDSLLGLEI